MKRNIILLVSLIIISAVFCLSASALEGKSGPYSYEVKKNGDLKITAFNWDAYGDEDVYIPKMIDGYSVTEIGDSAFSSSKSKSVAVIIPDTIVSIGEKAFFETRITTMHIPASVLSIGDGAFAGCKNIRQFSVDSSNGRYAQINGVLYNKIEKKLIAYPYINFNDFSIPEGIVSIAPFAFYQCQVGIIVEPSSLVSIGHHAFESAKITGIGEGHSIILSSVSTIEESAFENCEISYGKSHGFNSIIVSNVQTIPNYCFKGVKLGGINSKTTGIYLSDSLLSIGDYAFAECGFVDILSIPSSVETIGKYAFMGLNRLAKLEFARNSSLKTIDEGAFMGTDFGSRMTYLELPNGIETIGNNAFYYEKSSLNSLTIPTSVKSVGDNICDRRNVNISAEEGSYAYFWAIENGYTISHPNDDSWLTESGGEEEQPDTSWLNN